MAFMMVVLSVLFSTSAPAATRFVKAWDFVPPEKEISSPAVSKDTIVFTGMPDELDLNANVHLLELDGRERAVTKNIAWYNPPLILNNEQVGVLGYVGENDISTLTVLRLDGHIHSQVTIPDFLSGHVEDGLLPVGANGFLVRANNTFLGGWSVVSTDGNVSEQFLLRDHYDIDAMRLNNHHTITVSSIRSGGPQVIRTFDAANQLVREFSIPIPSICTVWVVRPDSHSVVMCDPKREDVTYLYFVDASGANVRLVKTPGTGLVYPHKDHLILLVSRVNENGAPMTDVSFYTKVGQPLPGSPKATFEGDSIDVTAVNDRLVFYFSDTQEILITNLRLEKIARRPLFDRRGPRPAAKRTRASHQRVNKDRRNDDRYLATNYFLLPFSDQYFGVSDSVNDSEVRYHLFIMDTRGQELLHLESEDSLVEYTSLTSVRDNRLLIGTMAWTNLKTGKTGQAYLSMYYIEE